MIILDVTQLKFLFDSHGGEVCMRRVKKYLIGFLLISLPQFTFAIMCPANFNTIDIGSTMQEVIQLCGLPDEQNEYKETIALPNGSGVKEKTIVHIKFIYHFPQPAALIFADGILKDRELLHS